MTHPKASKPPTQTEPAFPLRAYQRDAIDAVTAAWGDGNDRVAAVLPTGAGKTVVLSHLIAAQHGRALVLAHRDELVRQAADKVAAVCPGRTVGIVKAEEDHPDADIVVASVQTLARPHRRARLGKVELVVVDEAHHAAADTYRDVLEHFGCFDGTRTLGVSATLARTDDRALAETWQTVAYKLDILDLIDAGHLCDIRGISVHVDGLDLDGVGRAAGDYQVGALAERMEQAEAWPAAAEAYRRHAPDRAGIIFTPTVAAARDVAANLTALGITTEAIDGTTPTEQRRATLARFKAGHTQVLANCGVLTEGFDAPWVSAVLIARPTSSPGLFVQMAGRGLRPHPGKSDCLLIDLVGTAQRHQLATIADLTGRDVGTVPEGESLGEAHARHATESRTTTRYLGELTATEIDLFDRDGGAVWPEWQGVRFIDIASLRATLFIAPGRAGYAVVLRSRSDHTKPELTLFRELPFRAALHQAETWAARRGSQLVRRNAPWRNRPATTRQLETLRRMRLPIPSGITAGQASLAIVTDSVARDFTRRPPRGHTPIEVAS